MGTSRSAWDVVIVDATGKLGEHGYPLHAELIGRGLRVKLDIVPALRVSAIPAEVFGDAHLGRFLVMLMTIEEETKERPGVAIETTAYIGAPGAQVHGQPRMFLPRETASPDGYVETGRLPRDLEGLANRIAARVPLPPK